MNIEPLESRIAPAGITYTDVDGDLVKISSSKGDLAAAAVFNFTTIGGNIQCNDLDVSNGAFDGADIIFTVTKKPGGDGLVSVGRINGGAHALGKVVVPGDLAVIDAGDGTQSVASLSVRSMGKFSTFTQPAGADLHSDLDGVFGTLNVKGDVEGVTIAVIGGSGILGTVNIGGSLIGGGADFSGEIHADVGMGVVKIGRDIHGSEGMDSGYLESFGKIHSITVGGSLIGATGSYFAMGNPSAQIWAEGDIDVVKIGRDLKGGAGDGSGAIGCGGSMGQNSTVSVGRSLLGGDGDGSGHFFTAHGIGKVVIGRDVIGGNGVASGGIGAAAGSMSSLSVGGSIIGGSGLVSGNVSAKAIGGLVKVSGSLIGGSGASSGVINGGPAGMHAVTIGGSIVGGSNDSTGMLTGGNIDSVTIGGSVIGGSLKGDNSGIMRHDTGEIRSTGNLGAVKIGGDLVGGSITSPAADSLVGSGYIEAAHIVSVTIGGSIIGGSIIGGTDDNGGFDKVASIRASDDIGPIVVKGSIAGNESGVVVISARGQAAPVIGDVAIKSLTVGGDVRWALIVGGWKPDFTPDNGNAQIGAVKVGGNWDSSSLNAGMDDPGGDGFAHNDAPIIAGGGISKIASVAIGGVVTGNFDLFYFGFEAHTIGKFKAGGVTLPFADATPLQTFALSLNSGNVFAVEL